MTQSGSDPALIPSELPSAAAAAPAAEPAAEPVAVPAVIEPVAAVAVPQAAAPHETPATEAAPTKPAGRPRRPLVSDDTFDAWVAAREQERQSSLLLARSVNEAAAQRGERRRLFAELRRAAEAAAADAEPEPFAGDDLARRVHEAGPQVRAMIESLLDLPRKRGRRS
jgi:hypothetical protein